MIVNLLGDGKVNSIEAEVKEIIDILWKEQRKLV